MSRRVVIDTSILAWVVDPGTALPAPPAGSTGDAAGRLRHLVDTLDEERAELLIPAPVLAEIFSVARRDHAAILADLTGRRRVLVLPFGEREAIECGFMLRDALLPTARAGRERQLVKFDAQIVAIAKTAGADTIYTTDGGVARMAERAGLTAPDLWALPMPPADQQENGQTHPS
jgi:predicted nucleic acid-binding protein